MENKNFNLDEAIKALRAQKEAKLQKSKDYEVGYGKPPKDTRFKKGRSGNPAGRKKKVMPISLEEAIKLELNKKIALTNKDGVKEKISLFSLLARSLVQDAIKNDGPSRKILLQSKNILKCNIPEAIKFIDERNNPAEVDEIPEEHIEIMKELLHRELDRRARERD